MQNFNLCYVKEDFCLSLSMTLKARDCHYVFIIHSLQFLYSKYLQQCNNPQTSVYLHTFAGQQEILSMSKVFKFFLASHQPLKVTSSRFKGQLVSDNSRRPHCFRVDETKLGRERQLQVLCMYVCSYIVQ